MVFGGAPIGGLFAPVSDDQAAAALEAAWTAGIRAFDTAPHYGAGLSEQRIGRFLAGRPRAEFALSTKVGRRLVPAAGDIEGLDGFHGTPKLARVRDYSRDGTLATLEGSLRRLGIDRIDIALIHDPDDYAEKALDGAYAALDQLRSEGTIRAVGVGMNQAPLLEWFVERASYGTERAAAEGAVAGVTGVRNVINDIEISYVLDPVDVDLHVQEALDRSAVVPDGSDVKADTKDGVITLTGHVRTWAEHDAVVGAALMARGVVDIRDELEVTGRRSPAEPRC